MNQRTPIPRKRKRPRRKRPELFRKAVRDTRFLDKRSYVTKGGRLRLYGLDYQRLRWDACLRAWEGKDLPRCECGCNQIALWVERPAMPYHGELSHNEHGGRKSDELERVKWMRHECHMKLHNCNGKPVPRKVF